MLDLILAGYILTKEGLPNNFAESPLPSSNLISVSHLPTKLNSQEAPLVNAESFLLFDANSATVLAEKNSNEPMPIASLTKLMTAFLAEKKLDQNEIIITGEEIGKQNVRMSKILGLPQRAGFYAQDLIGGMLIHSAADAAVALAKHISGSEGEFVNLMNKTAQELKLSKTNFTDSYGLSIGDISTSQDVNELFKYIWNKPILKKFLGLESLSVCSTPELCYKAETTNLLLKSEKFTVLGGKTGTTDIAGQCLIVAIKTPHDATIFLTILNSEDRWSDADKILTWALENFEI